MKFFKSLHPNIRVRIIATFLSRLVGGMIFPFMAVYFSSRLGAEITGLLMVVNVLIGTIVGFYGGYLTDTIGRKKVLVIGEILALISFSVMALANSPFLDSVWLTFIMFIINGISWGLIGPAGDAMMIDVSTPETRTFIFSLNYWAINAGFMLGGLVGGFMFKNYRFQLYIILAAVTAFTLFLFIKFITETYVPKPRSNGHNVFKDAFASYRSVLRDKTYMLFTVASIFIMALEFQRTNYISIHISETFESFKLSIPGFQSILIDGYRMIGFLGTENTLIIVLFTMLVAKLVTKRKQRPLLYVAVLLQSVGFAAMGYATAAVPLLLFCLIQSVGEMIFVPVSQTYRANMMDENARGAYSAVGGLVFRGGHLLGALGITLSAWIGAGGMAITMLALAAISIFIYEISLKRYYKQQSKIVSD